MLDGHEREIRIVLVVDGVELDVLDEFEQVRELTSQIRSLAEARGWTARGCFLSAKVWAAIPGHS